MDAGIGAVGITVQALEFLGADADTEVDASIELDLIARTAVTG